MLKVVDLNYHCHNGTDNPADLVRAHLPALGYAKYFAEAANLSIIKHIASPAMSHSIIEGIHFFPGKSSFNWHPRETHDYLKRFDPDIVIVQGFIFPVQTWHLQRSLRADTIILVQHHGEQPYGLMKSMFQHIAFKGINGCLFTAAANATPWQKNRIISSNAPVYSLLEASTDLQPVEKSFALAKTGMQEGLNILWVGRLNENKDPITALLALQQFHQTRPDATLYMIYNDGHLLAQVQDLVQQDPVLNASVRLVGSVPHHEMANWYSAADIYISASHREGSGYALIEAMACGCVPVVSDIPSFRAITQQLREGYYFSAGKPAMLAEQLARCSKIDKESRSQEAREVFSRSLAFSAIAQQLLAICETLYAEHR